MVKPTRDIPKEPEQAPVAWMNDEMDCIFFDAERPEPFDFDFWKPLYTTPPQRKPLTVKDIKFIATYCDEHVTDEDVIEITRRVEAAHGIKEDA